MIVGTTALPMTTAISSEYCPLSMMPWVSPKRAEIDPKVSPVDMSRVVYIPSFWAYRKNFVAGYTPAIFVAIFERNRTSRAKGAATIADTETYDPALRK